MISRVVENLRPPGAHRFVFVVLREHIENYDAEGVLRNASPGSVIVAIDEVTRGAAETALLAESYIGDGPLVIANSDQWVDADLDVFYARLRDHDGLILTMRSQDPKWSYVKRDNGEIVSVVEKVVVSDEATVGIYGFRTGKAFVRAAKAMIAEDDRYNGEFYVAPVYSHLVREGLSVGTISIGAEADGMWGLGTPEDLEVFLASSHARTLAAH